MNCSDYWSVISGETVTCFCNLQWWLFPNNTTTNDSPFLTNVHGLTNLLTSIFLCHFLINFHPTWIRNTTETTTTFFQGTKTIHQIVLCTIFNGKINEEVFSRHIFQHYSIRWKLLWMCNSYIHYQFIIFICCQLTTISFRIRIIEKSREHI